MQYMLLIYNCDRPEPGDPRFPEALASVNAFADECRRRGAFVAGHPLQGEHTATTVAVRAPRPLKGSSCTRTRAAARFGLST